jgi:hypothetical protein
MSLVEANMFHPRCNAGVFTDHASKNQWGVFGPVYHKDTRRNRAAKSQTPQHKGRVKWAYPKR